MRGARDDDTARGEPGDAAVFSNERFLGLLLREKYLNALLRSSPDSILVLDGEWRVAFCSDKLIKLTGVSGIDAVRGMSVVEFYSLFADEQFARRGGERVKRLKESRTPIIIEMSVPFPGNGGDERRYTVQTVPILNEDGEFDGVIAMYHDITELRRAEKEKMERLKAESELRARWLETDAKAARAANEAKSRFLASMSHEIRNPMNAIMGMCELMPTENLSKTQLSYLSDMRKVSKTLLSIINDILDFSKIEAGKLDIAPVDYSVRALFDDIHSIGLSLTKTRGIELDYNFDDLLPDTLYGDETRVRQIILNLVSNAVKYTREGCVRLSAELILRDGREFLSVECEDTGIGIKKTDMPRLFERFERFDLERNEGLGGSGLGLSIVKSLVDALGGSVTAESEYGVGSKFTVVLPVERGDPRFLREVSEVRDYVVAERARALVVDDNPINLTVACGYLKRHGLNADTAPDGETAIRMVEEAAYGYDIVFMDHMMPGLDGFETTKLIREKESSRACAASAAARCEAIPGKRAFCGADWGETGRCGMPYGETAGVKPNSRRMPIVALSANVLIGERDKIAEAGIDDFLPKPILDRQLNSVLLTWLPPDKTRLAPSSAALTIELSETPAPAARIASQTSRKAKSDIFAARAQGHVDFAVAEAALEGDKKLLRHVLKLFSEDHSDDWKRVNDSIESGDVRTAERVAHTLKSVSAMIGAKSLNAAAALAEANIASGVFPDSRWLEEATEELEAVQKEVAQYLNTPDSAPSEGAPREKQLSFLDTLEPLLEQCSAECLNLWESMSWTLEANGDEYTEVADAIMSLDFPKALEKTAALRLKIIGQ